MKDAGLTFSVGMKNADMVAMLDKYYVTSKPDAQPEGTPDDANKPKQPESDADNEDDEGDGDIGDDGEDPPDLNADEPVE
jgi:hypothetical protein